MALEFARVHVIGRTAGHSAIKAAAYRSGEKLFDAQEGRTANYSHRSDEVLHSEILLPEGANAEFSDRETLWNAIEERENEHKRRSSAQLAKDHIIALPKELNHAQHVELIQDFARQEFISKGLVVDLNIHGHSDGNPHAHLMVTTRALEGDRFGLKCREINGGFYGGKKVRDAEMLKVRWADFQESYFAKNELDIGVLRNDGEYPSEIHLGNAHGMDKNGKSSVVKTLNDERIAAREAAILANPSIVINRVAGRKSVFSEHDLFREASSVVQDSQLFSALKEKLIEHDSLIRMESESGKVMFTTQGVIDTEMNVRGHGEQLSRSNSDFSGVNSEKVLEKNSMLSAEQREAVRFVCEDKRLASVVGLAGAGKSTTLGAVREVLESHNHSVRGIALAGKAAEELEKASGIHSSTIHSWLYRIEDGREVLGRGDVIVMDEAGMVDNALMERVIKQVNESGAKLVMVGDPEQLQPIQAGRPFRDLSERHLFAEISTIRRQSESWQRENTLRLARGEGDVALMDYAERGFVHNQETRDDAIEHLVTQYLADVGQGGEAKRHAVLAHSNAAVDAMNEQIRTGLIDQGLIEKSKVFSIKVEAETNSDEPDREAMPTTRSMEIGIGDRVLFTKNDSNIGVKNGTLGEVIGIRGHELQVKTDSNESVAVDLEQYSHLKHGYAMTIHKSQGITVDKTSVLATPTLNKHLGYVGLSRHRGDINLYYGKDDFPALEKLANRFTQIERSESVLDFAARHEVNLETGEKESAPIEQMCQRMPVDEAMQTLESTRLSLVEGMNREIQAEIKAAESAEQKTKTTLEKHRTSEPRQGLLASTSKHQAWSNKLESLTRDHRASLNAVSELRETLESNQEAFSRKARREAAEQHPEAASILSSHKTQEKASKLYSQIESLQQEIAALPSDVRAERKFDTLHNKLDRVIQELQRDKNAVKTLTDEQVVTLKKATTESVKQTRAQQRKGLDRGDLEL